MVRRRSCQWLEKHSGKNTWVVHGKSELIDIEKERKLKIEVRRMFVIFFDIKWIVHKESVLAGQTLNSEYYCKNLLQENENVRNFRQKLLATRTWPMHHNAQCWRYWPLIFESQLSWLFLTWTKISYFSLNVLKHNLEGLAIEPFKAVRSSAVKRFALCEK
jgi:hypothetical protein